MKYKNNPFNIRSGFRWLGLTGTKNGFCEFKSIDFGVRAACVLLLQSYRQKGCCTPTSIINRFAPPSENDTKKYISYVCGHVFPTLHPKEPLFTYDEYVSLLKNMAFYETGTVLSYDYIFSIITKFHIVLFKI